MWTRERAGTPTPPLCVGFAIGTSIGFAAAMLALSGVCFLVFQRKCLRDSRSYLPIDV
jgi:hypothetical protein